MSDLGRIRGETDAELLSHGVEWLRALLDVAEASQGFARCLSPTERSATPEEVDEGCELGIAYDDCGFCSGCKLRDALDRLGEL